jgi:hypothetical protein
MNGEGKWENKIIPTPLVSSAATQREMQQKPTTDPAQPPVRRRTDIKTGILMRHENDTYTDRRHTVRVHVRVNNKIHVRESE